MSFGRLGTLGAGFGRLGGSTGGGAEVEPPPEWILEGASHAWDFVHNRYYNDNLTFSRASQAQARDANNELLSFASGVLRLTDKGILIEGGRSVKTTPANYNPTATTGLTKRGDAAMVLSVVDDTAELQAAGLITVCSNGDVYKLDNTAGVANASVELAGTPGNTNTHIGSGYVRGSGTGRIAFFDPGFVGAPGTAIPATYTRWVSSTNVVSTRVLSFVVAPGSIMYLILAQVEESAFQTSEVLTAGSTASRATDLLYQAQSVSANLGSVIIEATAPHYSSGNQILFQLDNDTDNHRLQLLRTGGNLRFIAIVGGSSVTAQTIAALADNAGDFTVGLSWNGAEFKYAINGGVTSTLGGQTLRTTDYTHIRIGSGRTTEHWFSYIKRVDMFPIALT